MTQPELEFPGGVYIECGANDGVNQSNTIYLERNLGWTGILVEPNQHKLDHCKEHRSSKQNKFYSVGLVSDESKKTVVGNFDETDVGESMSASISEVYDYFDEELVVGTELKKKNRPQIEVPCRTLNSIFTETS